MENAVSIKGISKRFGKTLALDSVSFQVPPHSIFGLLGPNGAGKTTLFSVIANFLKADNGNVEVLGIDTRELSRLKGRLTILPQDAQFQRNIPIVEQLVFFRLLDGKTRQEAEKEVLHTLDLVGLQPSAKRSISSLSHGMLKRLGIAQAFLGHPEVILLDEPTAGLDPANARQLRDLIKELRKRATIVISSHNMAEIQEMCDHVAILDHGKLLKAGTVETIIDAGREYHLGLSRTLTKEEKDKIKTISGIKEIKEIQEGFAPDTYQITLDLSSENTDLDTVLTRLFQLILDKNISPRKFTEGRSLETHFLEITKGKKPD